MLENVIVVVNGQGYTGWKNISISRTLGKLYSTLKLKLVEDPQITIDKWVVGSTIRVFSNNNLIFNGNIFTYDTSLSSNQSTLNITCYDKPFILSRSNPYRDNIEFQGFQIKGFVEALTKPFDVEYEFVGPSNDIVLHNRIDLLNTVEKEIKNGLLSLSAATFTSTADASIKIITNEEYRQAGSISNPKKINYNIDETGRFNTYEVVSSSSESFSIISTAQQVPTIVKDELVNDESLKRSQSTGNGTDEFNSKYAEWMKNTSYAFSRKVKLTNLGWRNNFNEFYSPGDLIYLQGKSSDRLGCSGEWLINSITFKQTLNGNSVSNQGGTISDIELVKKEIYSSEPKIFEDEDTGIF